MRVWHKSSAVGLAAFAVLAIAPAAWAGCAAEKSPAMFLSQKSDDARLIRIANDNAGGSQQIVGLWAIQLTAGAQTVDFGYSAWHSDGTEIMNSGGHPASTGNFCLGVWAQTGPNRYHLNHFALAYDPTKWNNPGDATHAPGGLIARINLVEDVVLDQRSNRFTGTFTQVGYDPISGAVIPFFGASGQIVGTRVMP